MFYFNAANHENDTCFGNGLVMGSADCKGHAGLAKTPEKLFRRKPGPLPDTLQAAVVSSCKPAKDMSFVAFNLECSICMG